MYKIDKQGNIYSCHIDWDLVNNYLSDLKKSLTKDYYILESQCKLEAEYSSQYTSVFMGSTVPLPIKLIEETLIGTIPNYQYYEELYITDKFRVHNTLKVRVDHNFKFTYFIDDTRERLPMVLINKIKKVLDN